MNGSIELKCGCSARWHLSIRGGKRVGFYDAVKLVPTCSEGSHAETLLDIHTLLVADRGDVLLTISRDVVARMDEEPWLVQQQRKRLAQEPERKT